MDALLLKRTTLYDSDAQESLMDDAMFVSRPRLNQFQQTESLVHNSRDILSRPFKMSMQDDSDRRIFGKLWYLIKVSVLLLIYMEKLYSKPHE